MAFTPTIYGYREGTRIPVVLPVDSAANGDISVNDPVIFSTAGYVTKAAAGDIPIGVSMQNVAVPSSDGGATCLVDVSEQSIYEYPPDTGTVTAGLAGLTCDFGGSQSINIDASTDDCILIRRVDTAANTVFVSLKLIPAGVV
jgi:hypothetical protein